jgi:acyl-CoA reductase-like NAD-dependent aldehyde dehydrogenase
MPPQDTVSMAGAIFDRDQGRALVVVRGSRAGSLSINAANYFGAGGPLGGFTLSGVGGREMAAVPVPGGDA